MYLDACRYPRKGPNISAIVKEKIHKYRKSDAVAAAVRASARRRMYTRTYIGMTNAPGIVGECILAVCVTIDACRRRA